MKAFERWLKRFYKNHQGDKRFNPQAKVGWRAALEWVKQDCVYTEDDGHECVDMEMIEKELGDE